MFYFPSEEPRKPCGGRRPESRAMARCSESGLTLALPGTHLLESLNALVAQERKEVHFAQSCVVNIPEQH